LTRSRGENQTLPEDTDALLKHLEMFVMEPIAPWAGPRTGDAADDFEKLIDILKEAVELSLYLRRQRPYWSVRFPDMPVTTQRDIDDGKIITHRYHPETMRDRQFDDVKTSFEELRKLFVGFVLSPGLNKKGRLEGDQFDRDSVVKKIEVVVWR
jgi:hypothetical protein